MGLIHEDGEYVTLTDILGAEDAFGDMDFKVAGTRDLITALQLDTKLDGIPASVLAAALKQAKGARLAILDVMQEAIEAPGEMSPYAPRIITIKIPVDKIGEVIGPKGKMINSIQDDTGAEITIEDDGTIYIGATDGPSAEAARADDQRDRQPAHARGRRALPRHGRQDHRRSAPSSRCCRARTACCTSRRSASCTAASADRERRGRHQGRREGPGRGHRDRLSAASCRWSRSRSSSVRRGRGGAGAPRTRRPRRRRRRLTTSVSAAAASDRGGGDRRGDRRRTRPVAVGGGGDSADRNS